MSLEMKVKLQDGPAHGESTASVGRHFCVNESTVRTIKKTEATIIASV